MLVLLWLGPVVTNVSPPLRCPPGKVLVRADFKACPTGRRRQARAVKRACCQGANGRIHCLPYPRCAGLSPL